MTLRHLSLSIGEAVRAVIVCLYWLPVVMLLVAVLLFLRS